MLTRAVSSSLCLPSKHGGLISNVSCETTQENIWSRKQLEAHLSWFLHFPCSPCPQLQAQHSVQRSCKREGEGPEHLTAFSCYKSSTPAAGSAKVRGVGRSGAAHTYLIQAQSVHSSSLCFRLIWLTLGQMGSS